MAWRLSWAFSSPQVLVSIPTALTILSSFCWNSHFHPQLRYLSQPKIYPVAHCTPIYQSLAGPSYTMLQSKTQPLPPKQCRWSRVRWRQENCLSKCLTSQWWVTSSEMRFLASANFRDFPICSSTGYQVGTSPLSGTNSSRNSSRAEGVVSERASI